MKKLRHLLFSCCLLATAATAADPARTMFGIELGSRFAFPPCARGEDALTKRYCHNATQVTKTPWGAEEYQVFYPRAEVVPYARGELVVDVVNGVIEAIHVSTWGIEAQGTAMAALKAKYGPPARSHTEKIKGMRSRLATQFAEWDMKDFAVRFDGTTSTIDWGRITLITHRYDQLRKEYAKRAASR